jgi:uncharacterized membrane protein
MIAVAEWHPITVHFPLALVTTGAAVGLHVKWAIFSTLGVLLVAVWRGAGAFADARPSRWFLGVLWALVAALVMTGYRGGENVYRYGVGVSRAATAAGPPSRESTP